MMGFVNSKDGIIGLAIGVIAIPVWLGQRAKKYKKTAPRTNRRKTGSGFAGS